MLTRLRTAVERGENILISGGPGTGKTTMLNALARLIPDAGRIVIIEDPAEIDLPKPDVVRFEARRAADMWKVLMLLTVAAGLWVTARVRPEWIAPATWGLVMPLAAPQPAQVMRWIDGDTVIVKRPTGLERVRLIGIDAPDRLPENRAARPASTHGLTARALARLDREAWTTAQQLAAPGSRVFLQRDRIARDAHGQHLAYVFAETGELLNLELVSRGAVWATRDVADCAMANC